MNDKQFHCPENGSLQQFSTLPGTFSPTGTFNDLYQTLLPPNSSDRSQSKPLETPSYMFPELATWDNVKLPDKIDLININSKDLSPSSYYSNIDPTPPVDVQYGQRFDGNQWGNIPATVIYGQQTGTFSSCAQVSKLYEDPNKSTTYCSIQKSSSDRDVFKSCSYYNSNNAGYNISKPLEAHPNLYSNYSTFYDPKYSEQTPENAYFSQNTTIYGSGLPQKSITEQKEAFDINYLSTLDQHTEASNDESDIVVEDSSSDCSEEQEPHIFYETTKCLVCNTQYTPLGLQFYVLTSENPLTMSSQIPVKNKILEFVSNNIFSEVNHLCNNCLGLMNTIDHIQLKLDNLIRELLSKFKSSCSGNIVYFKNKNRPKTRVKFSRYRCKKCNRVLCVKNYLLNHVKRHKSKGYLCELCGKTVPTLKKLKCHLKIHTNPKTPLISAFKCSNKCCDKIFRTKFHQKEHQNFCLGLLPFKCKNVTCNKKFASTTKLKSHMKLKHDKKFIAICSICNIGFIKVSDYKSHMVTHSIDKKFACDKCDKVYKTISNLNFHLKSHEKVLPYICTVCQKGFMRKEYHEAHMNNHKGIKNFGCPACDKKFVSQKNLDAHLKYHEGTVKSNTCNICKKVITSSFEEHLRVHSNLKEFDCSVCKMKFNTKNSLSKHEKKKHPKSADVT